LISKLTDEELDFIETFYDALAMSEIVFSDFDNLTAMVEEEFAHIRLGQLPLVSQEMLLDENPEISAKANFHLKKGCGDIYCLGGRLFGKTLFVEKVDMLIHMLTAGSERVGFSSYDALHIRGVIEDMLQALEHHPLFRLYQPQVTRSPNYRISLRTGYLCDSVNMNLTGKKPGAQFFQKHFTRLYIEEASFETEAIYRQRRDSVSEDGCVYRIAGMTNFTKYSPCGKNFYDYSKKTQVLNLPQYVNPKWDEKGNKQAVKDFGGKQSVGYRIFIKGEVVEEGVSVYDMERVRQCYNEKRHTKVSEISKKDYPNFKSFVVVERPANAELCYICADIGESAPSEIAVIFVIKGKYRYVYNITLYGLTDKEQFQVFKWLTEQLQANFVALDTTDGTGRAIFRSLEEVFPRENLIWVSFNEKLPVDFEKNEQGNIIHKKGKPVYKEEYVSEWSINNLKTLLYDKRIELPIDHKLDMQLNSIVALHSGTRVTYECMAQENHLFQAFQVFSIAQWLCEFLLLKPAANKNFCKTGV